MYPKKNPKFNFYHPFLYVIINILEPYSQGLINVSEFNCICVAKSTPTL